MCAIGRALMSGPKLLLLDEPSAGLAPVVVQATFEVIRQMRAEGYTVLIVEQNIRQVLKAGASGYVLKHAAASELVEAIRTVYRGDAVLSPTIARKVIEDYLRTNAVRSMPAPDELTPREREVLQLIAEGHTSKEIAELLGLSIKTVQAHRASLMQKLNLHDRSDLVKYAIQKKIIEV
jgi:DNA-binding NarL/FixJ family response regulator